MDGFVEEAFASAFRGLAVAGMLFDIGFLPTFGDVPFWNSLASCVLIPYISSYPCVTTLLRWGHGRSVAPETASMEEGARFRLDTSHHRPGPLVTRCDCAAPRGVRSR